MFWMAMTEMPGSSLNARNWIRSLPVSTLPYSACSPVGMLFHGGRVPQAASDTASAAAATAINGLFMIFLPHREKQRSARKMSPPEHYS